MKVPEKVEFLTAIESIESPEVREKLVTLYDHLKGYSKITNSRALVKEVLTYLYRIKGTSEILIPYSFLDTPIATVIFTIMYGSKQENYSMRDIIEFTKSEDRPNGYTKQYLKQEVNDGYLKGVKSNNRWVFSEDQVNEYLTYRGFKPINGR